MRLNKFVCWTIIGVLCVLIGYLFYLLLELFEHYSGLLQVVFIGIGFIFVWKQINISKNKDILFSFQKDINLFMAQFYSKHLAFYYKLIKIIDGHEYRDQNIDNHETLNSKIISYINEYRHLGFNDLTYPLINYKWWLSDMFEEYNKIFQYPAYKRMFYFLDEYHNHLNKNIKDNYGQSESLEPRIKEVLLWKAKHVSTKFTEDFNIINTKFNELLGNLAKKRGIL